MSMRRRKGLVLLTLMIALVYTLQISIVDAHTPGPMTLEYDADSDILTVTVIHVTADVNSHYIYEIVIEKNSVQVDVQTYTDQSDSSQVVETFTIAAIDGDVLAAIAKCSVSGQVTNQITVMDSTTTATTTSTTTTSTNTLDYAMTALFSATAIVAIVIVLVIVIIIKRR